MNVENGPTIIKRIVHKYLRQYAVQIKEFLTSKNFRSEVNDMINIVRSHFNKSFISIDKNLEDIICEVGSLIPVIVSLLKKNIKLCMLINDTFGLKPAKITVDTLIVLQTITYLILDSLITEMGCQSTKEYCEEDDKNLKCNA